MSVPVNDVGMDCPTCGGVEITLRAALKVSGPSSNHLPFALCFLSPLSLSSPSSLSYPLSLPTAL